MFDGQMEMSFGKIGHPTKKRSRAQWWFQRMRQIVDRATDWRPAPPPRPVQIWFPAADERLNGQVTVRQTSACAGEERQICE